MIFQRTVGTTHFIFRKNEDVDRTKIDFMNIFIKLRLTVVFILFSMVSFLCLLTVF